MNETPLTILARAIRILATVTDDIAMSNDDIEELLQWEKRFPHNPDMDQAWAILDGLNELLALANNISSIVDLTVRACGDCGEGFRTERAYYCPRCEIHRATL